MGIPQLQNPIVLVHGFFGFESIRIAGLTLATYFPGIPALLRAAGNRVFIPRLSPTAGVAHRAAELKAFIDRESPSDPVHLIAHSMGGLDSRYMISRLGMAHRVLSLTTLGTPHRGCSFADWGISRLERLVKPLLALFRIPTQGFYDLTTASCRRFNDEVPDAPAVRYFSVAGKYEGSYFSPEWYLPFGVVSKEEGPNDGVVSVASASYGENVDIWEGDHLSLVNWFGPIGCNRGFWRDPLPRYGPLVRRLADEGF
ncbi:MAG: alpha/beta fold hydrolase [Gemmataceae bacterium]|nr:alpha/beta fold hydrolase [Gemmataceae bacterium]